MGRRKRKKLHIPVSRSRRAETTATKKTKPRNTNKTYKRVNANARTYIRSHTIHSFREVQFHSSEATKKRDVGAILCGFGGTGITG